jgi:hypothetical protein
MCPACLTAAALAAAKLAGASGITAYGLDKWLARAPFLRERSTTRSTRRTPEIAPPNPPDIHPQKSRRLP